jgi:hypothetical protein
VISFGDRRPVQRFDREALRILGFSMRLPAMRRVAGLLMAVVWSGARLAQPLQPTCPHHAVEQAAAAVDQADGTSDEHAVHHRFASVAGIGMAHEALVAGASESVSLSDPAPSHPHHSDAPCECAAHCHAASSVALNVTLPTLVGPCAVGTTSEPYPVVREAPSATFAHRQPPSTAPPALRAI